MEGIPDRFKLGKGHVKFFYNKLYYLFVRYMKLYNECKNRGFNVQCYAEAWKNLPKELMNNYQPTYMDRLIVQERINEKFKQMKKYHVQNYVRYKHDMSANLNRLPDSDF